MVTWIFQCLRGAANTSFVEKIFLYLVSQTEVWFSFSLQQQIYFRFILITSLMKREWNKLSFPTMG